MNNLTQLLQDADPLRHEASHLDAERARVRSAIQSVRLAAATPAGRFALTRVAPRVAVPMVALIMACVVAGYAFGVRWIAPIAAQVRFEVRLAEERPAPGLVVAQVSDTGRVIYLHPETVVSNEDVASATALDGPAGFTVEVRLLPSGADRLRQATGGHVGRPVAIALDGRVVMAPTVRSPIGDSAVITGQLTETEARRIADGVSQR